MTPITINLDSTSLGSSGCILDLVRTLVGDVSAPELGAYREKTLGPSLVYGIAVHKFIDTMYKTGGNFPLARDSAKKSFAIPCYSDEKKKWLRDEKHLITTCYVVWSHYIETDSSFEVLSLPQQCIRCDGVGVASPPEGTPLNDLVCDVCKGEGTIIGPSTEINFSLPYYEDKVIKVNLCGTIDTVGKFKNGCYAIRDWKTTSSWKSDNYFQQYELSRQLRLYTLACKLMAERYPESIMGKIGATRMGAFIDGIFLKANANETECKRSEVFTYSDKQIAEFKGTLDSKIAELSCAIEDNHFPKQGILTGACEKKFQKCQFWHACKNDDSVAEVLLKRDFTRKVYNPLAFNE